MLSVGFVILTVGAWLSGASVGVTPSLRSEVTVPLLFTVVTAVIGVPGKAPATVIVAVVPFVVPVPMTLVPSYRVTVDPALTPVPTFTVIFWFVNPFLCFTSLAVIVGLIGLTFNVTVPLEPEPVSSDVEPSWYLAIEVYLNTPAWAVLGELLFFQLQLIPPGNSPPFLCLT